MGSAYGDLMRVNDASRLNRSVSVMGQGCWQLGSDWGDVDADTAAGILSAAVDRGVTFFDTADVYGDGRSELAVGRFMADHASDRITVATKMGRRANPHVAEAYTLDNFRRWTDRSRENLGVDTLDLVQLHCPPTEVYDDPATYEALRVLVEEGRISRWGVSVETCDQALRALQEPDLASIQIILNIFRRKPLEAVVPQAQDQGVAIIARIPLASGLLSGKFDEATTFAPDDHRTYNRDGQVFDIGETFSGVPYDVGVRAAREVADLTPDGWSTAQLALAWIATVGATTIIPGATSVAQAANNADAGSLPELDSTLLDALEQVYRTHIEEHVAGRW